MAPPLLGQAPEPPVVASPSLGRKGLLELPVHPQALHKAAPSPQWSLLPVPPPGRAGATAGRRLRRPRAEESRARRRAKPPQPG